MGKKKLVIFPCNGNGIEALDCIRPDDFDFIGFIDDDPCRKSASYEIFQRDILSRFQELYVLALPGSPASYAYRAQLIDSLAVPNDRFITAIHERASIGRAVKIGFNSVIMAGVVLTSNVMIGNHVCILPNSVIHHDSFVRDYTLIGSNVAIAGSCDIGLNCYIGSGSNIMNGISIGKFSMVGLGSNIIRSTGDHSKMVGNPARNINPQFV
jgi:sugar O-acyltransferase (sialic acid O-acetyltransferase NeuD family)